MQRLTQTLPIVNFPFLKVVLDTQSFDNNITMITRFIRFPTVFRSIQGGLTNGLPLAC
jgi:hypothetical protein